MRENGEHVRDWNSESNHNESSVGSPHLPLQALAVARGRRLHLLTAALIALVSAQALFGGRPGGSADQAFRPPSAEMTRFFYRSDGGQIASPDGGLPPNALTSLNLGQSIILKSARPAHLAHLPSLGPNSSAKAVDSGCLSSRQRKTLDGLIIESCERNNL